MRCQLVLASEVAGARASEPDSAIVALAPSNRADLVLQAQLDGADIVIPDDADSRTLEQAMTAARRLATRHFSAMSDYRSAVHELGTFLPVARNACGGLRGRGGRIRFGSISFVEL